MYLFPRIIQKRTASVRKLKINSRVKAEDLFANLNRTPVAVISEQSENRRNQKPEKRERNHPDFQENLPAFASIIHRKKMSGNGKIFPILGKNLSFVNSDIKL